MRKVSVTRQRRDADYRGQKTSVEWSKLVYQARRGRPGALEVLQDAIFMYFPKQFGRAQAEARRRVYVTFSGRTARRRFELSRKRNVRLAWSAYPASAHKVKPRLLANLPNPRSSPFRVMTQFRYEEDKTFPEFIAENAIVWSTKHGLRVEGVR